MADRYWVGGTASWDGTAGTKWASTSGGAGGQAIPTSADDVFFDANSTGTVTIATGNTGAKSINCTGFTGTITGSADISVAGNITLVSGQTYTHTGTVTITGTSTLITAGKSFSGVLVNGTGITVTLGDALNIGSFRSLNVFKGTFTTANFNLTVGNLFSSATNVRTINLGSSTCTITSSGQLNFSVSTNLTFDAGTSQINFATPNATINTGTLSPTFYNVTIGDGQNNVHVITGSNTFNNLTFENRANLGTNRVSVGGNQTITGTLTINSGATSISRRFYFYSSVGGTNRTLTAAAINIKNTDFRNITGAGAASWDDSSRTNYWGDAGGNSGITFATGRNVYWNLSGTQNWTATAWALTNNGTPNANNYPLIQDTATFTEAGSAGTVTLDTQGLTIGNITMADGVSNRTSAMTLNFGAFDRDWIFGSITFFSNLTISGGGSIRRFTMCGYNNTQDITMAGKILPIGVAIEEGYLNTVRLQDALNTSRTLTLTLGTFNANNYNVTCSTFTSANTNTRTITMGSGLWTLSGTGTGTSSPWNLGTNISNLTFNKDTANILFSDTSTTAREFRGSNLGLSYNKLTIGGATGTSTFTLSGNGSSFTELASTKTVAHTIRFSASQGTIDTWSVTGTAGNVVTVDSSSAGTRRNFTLTNVTSGIDYLSVKDIGELSGNKFYVGANSTDGGNNSNVYFTAPPSGNIFASASVSCTALLVALANRITQGNASINSDAAVNASLLRLINRSANITSDAAVQSIISLVQSAAAQVNASATVQSKAFYTADSIANITSTATLTSFANKIIFDSASITGNAQTESDAIRIRTFNGNINSSADVSSLANVDFSAIGNITSDCFVSSLANVTYSTLPVITCNATVVTNARILGEGWTPTPIDDNTWSEIPASDNTWTEITYNGNTWLRQG